VSALPRWASTWLMKSCSLVSATFALPLARAFSASLSLATDHPQCSAEDPAINIFSWVSLSNLRSPADRLLPKRSPVIGRLHRGSWRLQFRLPSYPKVVPQPCLKNRPYPQRQVRRHTRGAAVYAPLRGLRRSLRGYFEHCVGRTNAGLPRRSDVNRTR